jgi:23S rRNA (guanosine2251-2'-O)-methyltransferase
MDTVFGFHAVSAMLRAHPGRVVTVWLAADSKGARTEALVEQVNDAGVELVVATKQQLSEWADEGNHQGVVAQCKAAPKLAEADLWQLLDTVSSPLLLVLDGVTDPHNLGACLRTADAAGVAAVIVPRDKAASLTSTVRKVASGAAEYVPFFSVTNLARTLDQLKERGVWLVGTAGEASQTVYEVDLVGPVALVLGAEGKGMRRLTRERCDFLVHIPMLGSVSSLNVSVASGVCLFEALRQRQAASS